MRVGHGIAQQVGEPAQGAGLEGCGRCAQFVEQLQKVRQCSGVFCCERVLYAQRAEGMEQMVAEGRQILAAFQGLDQVKERG